MSVKLAESTQAKIIRLSQVFAIWKDHSHKSYDMYASQDWREYNAERAKEQAVFVIEACKDLNIDPYHLNSMITD